jgi:hypothetical protein
VGRARPGAAGDEPGRSRVGGRGPCTPRRSGDRAQPPDTDGRHDERFLPRPLREPLRRLLRPLPRRGAARPSAARRHHPVPQPAGARAGQRRSAAGGGHRQRRPGRRAPAVGDDGGEDHPPVPGPVERRPRPAARLPRGADAPGGAARRAAVPHPRRQARPAGRPPGVPRPRLHLHRPGAPALRARPEPGLPGWAGAARARRHPRDPAAGRHGRRPARWRAARRPRRRPVQHPDAGRVRARSDRDGPQRPHRPGDRPGGRDRADGRGALPAPQEQPGAHRRGRRRQDRDRRGHRRADRGGRRPGDAAGPAAGRAGPHRPGGRHPSPGRLRGAAEEGDRRDPGAQRRGDGLHRRAAHRRRRGRRRGLERRGQHAQARTGPRRAAHHRRHDARRVPTQHREGRRPGAPVPADPGAGAQRRAHRADPVRPARPLRGPPRGALHRRRHPGRGGAVGPLRPRPSPAGQGGSAAG